eukprot:465813-Amphidinium_carterae.1
MNSCVREVAQPLTASSEVEEGQVEFVHGKVFFAGPRAGPDFDDEEWDSALSEIKEGWEQVGICSREGVFGGPEQLLSCPTDVEVPCQNNSSGVVLGNTAKEVPSLVVPTAPCARRRKRCKKIERRQRFNAQPIYDVLLAKLPDMDARDAMRGEQLMADFLASGAWDEREAPSSSELEDASLFGQGGTLNKGRFFGGPKTASHGGFAEDSETVVGTPGFSKDREVVFEPNGPNPGLLLSLLFF